MNSVIQVQTWMRLFLFQFCANAFGKDMNPFVPQATSK